MPRTRAHYSIAAITNDIFTQEDAEIVARSGAIDPDRIIGVETGGCPHTAIREDVSMNMVAIDTMVRRFPDLDLIMIESGGDNLAATFSPELADSHIYVIDVGEGEKIPRKGGPGITRSPLLLINKMDIAPYVGADLAVMDRDARRMRGTKPYIFTNMKSGAGLEAVITWIEHSRPDVGRGLKRALMQVVLPNRNWVIGKHALMNLHVVKRNGRTEIDPKSWRIPYQWQGCHYQDNDDQPFLLTINSGGGFVEGDTAELYATMEPATRALITTTSASKFYKCPEGVTSRETISLKVGPAALLEYYPDEAIVFANSRVERRTVIELDPLRVCSPSTWSQPAESITAPARLSCSNRCAPN